MTHYHRHRNSGCGTVFLALFLVACIPASFATPGMWWIGVLLIAFFALAILGAIGKARAKPVSVARSAATVTTRHRLSRARRCAACGGHNTAGAMACRYCAASLVTRDDEETTVRWRA